MNPRARRELNAYLGVFSRAHLRPPTVTSTDRTSAEQGALVTQGRGVPVSKHVYGLAADIIPAPDWPFRVTLAGLAANVRAWLPWVEAFPHGAAGRSPDHVHIEWPWGY